MPALRRTAFCSPHNDKYSKVHSKPDSGRPGHGSLTISSDHDQAIGDLRLRAPLR